jgi:tetratricopeptide (TPR) repeat protein
MSGRYGTRASQRALELGEYEDAVRTASEILETHSADAGALYDRARARELLEQYPAAVEDMLAAAQANARVRGRRAVRTRRRAVQLAHCSGAGRTGLRERDAWSLPRGHAKRAASGRSGAVATQARRHAAFFARQDRTARALTVDCTHIAQATTVRAHVPRAGKHRGASLQAGLHRAPVVRFVPAP